MADPVTQRQESENEHDRTEARKSLGSKPATGTFKALPARDPAKDPPGRPRLDDVQVSGEEKSRSVLSLDKKEYGRVGKH
jgi:hypothetical protein